MYSYVVEARWGTDDMGLKKQYTIEARSIREAKRLCYDVAADDLGMRPRLTVYVRRDVNAK